MINIEQANQIALDRMMEAHPILQGIGKAEDVIPGMHKYLILHAGPPVKWQDMAGPMKGAVYGALIYEGLAASAEEAEALINSGKIEFAPCHHHQAAGPMAGVISASMMVYIVENKTHGNLAFSGMNEGRGKVLRMGAYSQEVIERLNWLNQVFAPVVDKAIRLTNGIDIRTLLARSLHMGDEGHNRLDAGSTMYSSMLSPNVVKASRSLAEAYEVTKFLAENPICVLNPVMAAAKSMADAAHGVEGSTIVTTMARNGFETGLRISGLGDEWFTGPAGKVKGLYLPGFSEKDASLDIGDSTITETVGIGGFAMAAAPAIVNLIGGVAQDAIDTTSDMYEITATEHRYFTIPGLDFRGTPTGIDIRKVVGKNLLPKVNTGMAHRDPGIGQVGAGVVTPPMIAFEKAVYRFAEKYGYGRKGTSL